MSVLTPLITQTVNDCIDVSGRKITTQKKKKQNITLAADSKVCVLNFYYCYFTAIVDITVRSL